MLKKHNFLTIFIIILLLIFCVIIVFRIQASIALKNLTKVDSINSVKVIIAKQEGGSDELILPGNVWAWHEAPVFARTNGYVRKWYVDIGVKVKENQLLADIETPELDAQERQAQAQLNTAIAKNKLAQSTAIRWVHLLKTNSVSKQETDEKVREAQAWQATVKSAQANLDRLNELVSFERVIAPFDGVITARATDIGDLINAGSSTTARPLFRIAQTDPLRIYVRIPQAYSSRLQRNMKVSLHVAQHPHQSFSAILLDTANAIDPTTRTLLAQFVVENKQQILLPGSYTEVWFSFPIPSQTIRIPVNTLIFRAAGLQVATVNNENKIVLKSITINRDFGTEVEVANGISIGDKIVINPSDGITKGETVRVIS